MQAKDETNSAYAFDPDAEAEDIPNDDDDDDYVCDDVIFDEGAEDDETVGVGKIFPLFLTMLYLFKIVV